MSYAPREVDPQTLACAEEFWALRLGCPVAALQRGGLTLLAHPQQAVFVVATSAGTVVAAPPELHRRIEAVADLRALTDWETLRALVPGPARTVGAAWIGYTREPAGSTRDTQPFDSSADPALAKLRAAVTPEEWRHGNLDASEPPIFGCVEDGSVAAACGYQRLLDRVAHLGVVADSARRSRGAGRRAVAAALARALERGLLAQYQTLVANTPARRIAAALGFAHFATTLGARWGDP